MRRALDRRAPRAPDIDAAEQEQPDDVDEVPVPCGELEAEVLLRRELAGVGAHEADEKENRADDHMRAMEAGRHEERRAVDRIGERERRVRVFPGLHAGEGQAEQDRQREAGLEAMAVVAAAAHDGPR